MNGVTPFPLCLYELGAGRVSSRGWKVCWSIGVSCELGPGRISSQEWKVCWTIEYNELCQLLFVRLGSLVSTILPSSKKTIWLPNLFWSGARKRVMEMQGGIHKVDNSEVSWRRSFPSRALYLNTCKWCDRLPEVCSSMISQREKESEWNKSALSWY